MSNEKKPASLLKFLFFLLFFSSLALNLSLSRNLDKKDTSLSNLYKYKKAYIKMTQILGISPEDSEALLEGVKED
jgi:hypothetical protein